MDDKNFLQKTAKLAHANSVIAELSVAFVYLAYH